MCVDRHVSLCIGRGKKSGVPLSTNHANLFHGVKCPRMLKTGRGYIGSSGNVCKGRLARGLS